MLLLAAVQGAREMFGSFLSCKQLPEAATCAMPSTTVPTGSWGFNSLGWPF